MAIQKIKSLFYESPEPPKVVKAVSKPIKAKSVLNDRVVSIINEGILAGNMPSRVPYGSSPVDNRLKVGQALGGGGGYAGPIAVAKKPGETQFGIVEADDMNLDVIADEMKGAEATTEVPPAEVSDEAQPETPDASVETPETPPETPPTPEAPPEPKETPEQKVTKMFADTGEVDEDYSLNNENNVRLEKFKFVNAGIDLKKLIPEDDQKSGISSKDITNLLTPSQRDMLKDKNRELRKQYPLMDKREKNIIIHNSNVPISSLQQGQSVELSSDMKKQAYDKVNAYLEANFGKNWQDKSKAIEFLRTIKINFSESPAIRANLIDVSSMISEEGENYKLPLDKINVLVPSVIQDFIKANKEDPTFARSNIFRTITSAYNQESGTKGQIYVIFNSENLGEDKPAEGGEEAPAEGETPPKGETPAEGEVPTEGGEDEMASALENAVEPLPTE